MKLAENERIICPAIWIDDGKKYKDQPKNIKSGYVIFGNHVVEIFFRMTNKKIGDPINPSAAKLNEIHEGYYTSHKRFIKKYIEY